MNLNYTGVFATPDEIVMLKEKLAVVQKMPVIFICGVDASASARDTMLKACHAVALSHDLPEIAGYYGCDLETGEFVTT